MNLNLETNNILCINELNMIEIILQGICYILSKCHFNRIKRNRNFFLGKFGKSEIHHQ